jgi:hypothetical protein
MYKDIKYKGIVVINAPLAIAASVEGID